MERFRALVEKRFTHAYGVAAYANVLGVTARYLNDRCRAANGPNAMAIVHQRKALEARRLLLFTDMAIADIGASLGFEDPAYFARFFRREVGVSPTGFRAARPPLKLAP